MNRLSRKIFRKKNTEFKFIIQGNERKIAINSACSGCKFSQTKKPVSVLILEHFHAHDAFIETGCQSP